MVEAACDGGELVVAELEISGVTGAGSLTARAELLVAEAESSAQSVSLGGLLQSVSLRPRLCQ